MSKKLRKVSLKKMVLFFILGSASAAVFAGGAIAIFLIRSIPSPERLAERSVVESTKIFDRTGKVLLHEIHGEEKRTVISLADIPESVKWATISAEDHSFYKHSGIDWRGVLRALFKNVIRGDIQQGGSTITQQLVKNSILTGERTFIRKFREAVLAVLIEKKYSKDEILEFYLNQIPYGSNAYGIEAASQTYFAKQTKDLTLSEAAVLAALPKAPTYYSPYGSHRDELIARRNWILVRMGKDGYAPEKEVDKARAGTLNLAPPKQGIRAPHFALLVKEYLSEKYGEEFVEQGGLVVTTTLDWELQQEAEKILKEGAMENELSVGAFNASLVALNPKNGEILALVGSRDYWGKPLPVGCNPGVSCKFDPQVNIAVRPRQPGSAFKPFVYATAIKKGYTPETILFDVPTEFNVNCNPDGSPGPHVQKPEDCYHPYNYDGRFRGPVTLRQSLGQSLNVPSVKLLYLAGVIDSIKTAKEAGISTLTDPARYGLTLVLGGAEVKLLEMTSAYGVLAEEGKLSPPKTILRIENTKRVAIEEKNEQVFPVMDTEIARVINDILSDNDARVPVFHPRSALYFPLGDVAAKTGTTQDFRDAWVLGYTPSLAVGVWAGNNDNSPMSAKAASVIVAAPLWRKFMDFARQKIPPEDFIPPNKNATQKPVLNGIYRDSPYVKIDRISKKLATEHTPEDLIETRGTGAIRSILAFVDRNDPTGPEPIDPTSDPQFNNWQTAVQKWTAENNLETESLPQEYDNLHTPEKRPKITLAMDSETRTPLTQLRVNVSATYPLQEVMLFINEELIQSKSAPFTSSNLSFYFENPLPVGLYPVKITAYDAVGNRDSYLTEINVKP